MLPRIHWTVLTGLLFVTVLLSAQSVHAQEWVKVSAGTQFTLAISSDGTLWSWGSNNFGQLGIGSTESRYNASPMGTDTDWKDVAAGGMHAVALKEDGTLWAWGFNIIGQLGTGDTLDRLEPVQIGSDDDWVAISANYVNSAALKADGSLYMWGWNVHGTTGTGLTADKVTSPTRVAGGNTYSSVSCGGLFTLAIAADGTLWGWGFNAEGQLAQEDLQSRFEPVQIGSDTWKQVSAGFEYCTGIKDDGSLWTWGFNGNGQLGDGSTTDRHQPVQIRPDTVWSAIYAGASFNYGITQYGGTYAWGSNFDGQLGSGHTIDMNEPEWVPEVTGVHQIALAKGWIEGNIVYGSHTMIIMGDRTHICITGSNQAGQLGNGSLESQWIITCDIDLTTGVPFLPAPTSIVPEIYPNPASERVTVTFPASVAGPLSVRVYDVIGNEVLQTVAESGLTASLPTSSLKPGMYWLVGKDRTGRTTSGSFTIDR